MSIAALNILAPPHTTRSVKMITPKRPAHGCQAGIVTGEANLSVMTIGVNGGISEMIVAKLERGSFKTGTMINMGIIIGNMAGKDRD